MNMDLTFQGQTASEKGSGVVQYHPSAGDVTMNVTSSSGAGGQAEMILADHLVRFDVRARMRLEKRFLFDRRHPESFDDGKTVLLRELAFT